MAIHQRQNFLADAPDSPARRIAHKDDDRTLRSNNPESVAFFRERFQGVPALQLFEQQLLDFGAARAIVLYLLRALRVVIGAAHAREDLLLLVLERRDLGRQRFELAPFLEAELDARLRRRCSDRRPRCLFRRFLLDTRGSLAQPVPISADRLAPLA